MSKCAWFAAGVIVAFAAGILVHHFRLRSPIATDANGSAESHPRPAEFLYLDTQRVAAYLAQLDGGIAKSERLTETLTRNEEAKVSAGEFQVGASAQRQNFVEREVTPTAAASYFRLFSDLNQDDDLPEVSVDQLNDFMKLDEGSFVRFSSRDLRTPIYANSYLVVRQAGTLAALFPAIGASESRRALVRSEREDARNYAHQVGPNPRIVFALTPKDPGDESIKFLLPMHYRQITDERSLIKDGGGRFTVVGKVVRVFGKSDERRRSAYIDSPTRETWTKPLERVPVPLLSRSSRRCEPTAPAVGVGQAVQRDPATSGGDEDPTLRSCVESRLNEQTEIPNGGAVILPVAIYK